MRYIRTQTIIKKVCDEQIENPIEIMGLISAVKRQGVECSLVLSLNEFNSRNIPKARITSCGPDWFQFVMSTGNGLLKERVSISKLIEIHVRTVIEKMVKKAVQEDDVSGARWQLLDVDEE